MNDRNILWPIFVVLALACLTLGLATFGWLTELANPPASLSDAVYRAILSFSGSDIYLNIDFATQPLLWFARFLGPLSAASAVLTLLYFFVEEAASALWVRRRRDHLVLVGADEFSLSYAEERASLLGAKKSGKGQLTVLGSREEIAALGTSVFNSKTRLVATDLSDPRSFTSELGHSPTEVLFGDAVAHKNAERALAFSRSETTVGSLVLRSDDSALSREIGLWSEELGCYQTLSKHEMTARSLLTDIDFCEIARLRGQRRVHIGIIGLGGMGFAIAEEFAQRCHHPELGDTLVSTFDKQADEVEWTCRQDYAGLDRAIEFTRPRTFDALHLGTDNEIAELQALFEVADYNSFTAIVVTAGDDSRNARIGLRIRRIQSQQRKLLAPILVQMKMSGPLACEEVTDLTDGLFVFGGNRARRRDVALDELQLKFGKAFHLGWLRQVASERPEENSFWYDISVDQQRSNLRAGLSTFDVLRYLSLVPPRDDIHDDLRIARETRDSLVLDERISKAEHERWCAERFCAGWTLAPPPDRVRDDDRKLHNVLLPWSELSDSEKAKDATNIKLAIDMSCDAANDAPEKPAWRRRVRVLVVGPLRLEGVADLVLQEEAEAFVETCLAELPDSIQVELICPNAPGFDRRMAAAFLTVWGKQSSTPADLLLAEAGTRKNLNVSALDRWKDELQIDATSTPADKLRKADVRKELLLCFEAQWKELLESADGRVTRFDISEGGAADGLSDTQHVEYGTRLIGLADFVIAGAVGGFGSVTARVLEAAAGDTPVHRVDLPVSSEDVS